MHLADVPGTYFIRLFGKFVNAVVSFDSSVLDILFRFEYPGVLLTLVRASAVTYRSEILIFIRVVVRSDYVAVSVNMAVSRRLEIAKISRMLFFFIFYLLKKFFCVFTILKALQISLLPHFTLV